MKTNEELRHHLLLARSGDKSAYKLFLKGVLPTVTGLVTKKVFNADDQQDVVQEILLSLHKSLASYDDEREVLPWVYAIASRRIIDYIRKVTRVDADMMSPFSDDVTYHEETTNNSVEKIDLSCLEELPELTKQAIHLTKIEGYSTKEAAVMLDIKENALRTRISRGLKQLGQWAREGKIRDEREL